MDALSSRPHLGRQPAQIRCNWGDWCRDCLVKVVDDLLRHRLHALRRQEHRVALRHQLVAHLLLPVPREAVQLRSDPYSIRLGVG